MAMNDIEKALTVFRGMGDRDKDVATKYMHPTKYRQHNPQASDGVAGVLEWIDHLPPEKTHLQTFRAFQDGPYVVAQTLGDVFGIRIFFDIFKFEEGLIVEHWVFSEEAAPPNKSGHTQTDGPSGPRSSENGEKNKSLIREYYETVHIAGDRSKIPHYVSEDQIRHEPGVSDGLAAFLLDLKTLTQHRTIAEIKFVLGQGDFVFVAAKGTHEGAPYAYIDLYRVQGGKIAEHWGFPENIPPREKSKNSNGML